MPGTEEVKTEETSTEEQKPKTVEEVYERNRQKLDQKAAELEEDSEGEKPEEAEKAEQPKKRNVGDVIRDLKKERNDLREHSAKLEAARSEMEERLASLQSEIEEIKGRQKQGDISQSEAKREIAEAEDVFKTAVERISLNEDIAPYKDDIVKLARSIAQSVVEAELKPLKEREAEAMRKERSSNIISIYSELAEENPEMFQENEDGIMDLKPEYDEKAQEIVALFGKIEGGKTVYNPFYDPTADIDTIKKRMNMVIDMIKSNVKSVETVKKEVEKTKEAVAQSKKDRMTVAETPVKTSTPKSVEDFVSRAMKRHGMEAR